MSSPHPLRLAPSRGRRGVAPSGSVPASVTASVVGSGRNRRPRASAARGRRRPRNGGAWPRWRSNAVTSREGYRTAAAREPGGRWPHREGCHVTFALAPERWRRSASRARSQPQNGANRASLPQDHDERSSGRLGRAGVIVAEAPVRVDHAVLRVDGPRRRRGSVSKTASARRAPPAPRGPPSREESSFMRAERRRKLENLGGTALPGPRGARSALRDGPARRRETSRIGLCARARESQPRPRRRAARRAAKIEPGEQPLVARLRSGAGSASGMLLRAGEPFRAARIRSEEPGPM
jgi:hypothetical protein